MLKEIHNSKMLNQYLKETNFLANFSFPIEQDVRLYRSEPGEKIFENYGQNDKILYMVRGRAKIGYSLDNGENTLIDFPSAPFLFGEKELLGPNSITLAVTALDQCDLIGFPFEPYRQQLLTDCRFLLFLVLCLHKKESEKADAITRNASNTLEERLAYHLLVHNLNGLFTDSISDTALYLGVTYRHIRRVFNRFLENNFIQKNERGYFITNYAALEEQSRHIHCFIDQDAL